MLFTKEEYKERLNKVKKSMQNKGIDLLISQDTSNINYLTNFKSTKNLLNFLSVFCHFY